MDRRAFLELFYSKRNQERESSLNTTLAPYSGTFGRVEVVHLLKRAMFGAKKSDVDYFVGMPLPQAVDELLTPAPTPLPPVNGYNSTTTTDPDIPLGQTWVNGPENAAFTGLRRTSLKAWHLGLMIDQGRSIHEKMVLFWHNHFSTQISAAGTPINAYAHNALLRQHALGSLKAFTRAVTLDPLMLKYLNGQLNTATAPDENYARELQELFTVGKGPGSGYTEDDVREAAKVLTGWRVNNTTFSSYFTSSRHNSANKQFSAFYNNAVITGQTGTTAGDIELDALLDMIFATNEVALHICRKLYNYFIYYKIDATVETNIIEPLADIYRQNNYEILPVLRTLLNSEHFFDVLNRSCYIKSPMEYVAGMVREFGMVIPNSTEVQKQYKMWDYLRQRGQEEGQNLLDPPSVAGWPAYYQEPGFHELWINTDSLPKRIQHADRMVTNGYTYQGTKLSIDVLAFTTTFPNASNPDMLIDSVLEILYTYPASQNLIAHLKSILLSGQSSNSYWSDAWDDYLSDPANQTFANTAKSRLQPFYQYIIGLSEYHLS